MPVYFIQAGDNGPIKIGIARNPRKRLRQLQTANPERLRLLGTIDGDLEVERRIHSELEDWRLAGEWFRADEEVKVATRRLIDSNDGRRERDAYQMVYVEDGVITIDVEYPYHVELNRCNTVERLRGWVEHLSIKPWMTAHVMGRFVDLALEHMGFGIDRGSGVQPKSEHREE